MDQRDQGKGVFGELRGKGSVWSLARERECWVNCEGKGVFGHLRGKGSVWSLAREKEC